MKTALISTDLYLFSHGVRAISSYLKKHKQQTIILSMPCPDLSIGMFHKRTNYYKKYSKKAIENMIELVKDCELIGISSLAATSSWSLQIIQNLKSLNIPIVWGGIFPTTFPRDCLDKCDIVCVGEGEKALLELIEKIEAKEDYYNTKNFWFKIEDGSIIKNDVRDLIDPNKIPIQDYDIETNYVLERNKKIVKLKEKHFFYSLYYHGVRGCAFNCKYCCNYQLKKLYQDKGPMIRKRDIKLVVQDIETIIKRFPTIDRVWFTDDDINLRTREELKEFAVLFKEKVNLPIIAYMTPGTVDEEKLKYLIDAGLQFILMGIISGSDRVNIKIYNRPITQEQALKAVRILNIYRKSYNRLAYQFIITNPYETKEDVMSTINLLRKLPANFEFQAFGMVLFPGSPLYYRAVKDGYVKNFKDTAYNLDYRDLSRHINVKPKNYYLNSILFWMCGKNTKFRHGKIPGFILDFLLNESIINYFQNNNKLLAFINAILGFSMFMKNSFFRILFVMLSGVKHRCGEILRPPGSE